MTLSVIICAHNSDLKRLDRVFRALAAQTLPQAEWECLLVDNGSRPELAPRIDLSWHPFGRAVREETLGLTHARLKGIAEARGEYLVFVDDDCLPDPDYLARVVEIFRGHSFLGLVGGYGRAEYETPPPPWLTKNLRQYHLDTTPHQMGHSLMYVQMQPGLGWWFPVGAGMAVRRHLAESYAEAIRQDPVAVGLGRTGSTLTGAEDLDLGIHVLGRNFAIGKSRDMLFTHVVPGFRLELDYMVRLMYMSQYSTERLLVHRGWHQPSPLPPPSLRRNIKAWLGALRRHPPQDRCWQAMARGKADGLAGVPPDPRYAGAS